MVSAMAAPGTVRGRHLVGDEDYLPGPIHVGSKSIRRRRQGSILSEIFVSLTNDPPNPLGQHDIESMLTSQTVLPDGRLLNPERDSQLLCCVFTPPGFKSTEEEANGYHTFFLSNGGAVPYAWISNDGTLDFISSVYSHELAEACTDPVNAFYDTPAPAAKRVLARFPISVMAMAPAGVGGRSEVCWFRVIGPSRTVAACCPPNGRCRDS